MAQAKIIAVAGKGGVGKTSLSAAVVRVLTERYPDARLLAIDADPAVGLATALGIEVRETLDDIRRSMASGTTKNAADELLSEARFRLFDAMAEERGFAFLAIGRPETAGCYCTVNGYLKEVISLLAGEFDYVVIDGEAGIEQINRRVMEKVTHLMLITDSSKKGTQVVQTIKQVADELVMYDKVGVIANRLPNLDVKQYMDVGDIPVLSYILSDASLAEFDLKGESVFYLDDDAAIVRGAKEALIGIGILEA